ncbi:hypothetical protein CIB93_13835 [Streptomyces sp. WZ.A104]|uniref:hypothetical protein n=1 Tax=Streptomyces sp. WZ.A104 TaxID=2023771 RepID=UPI000BBBA806|nr:hypothetical protein [Streptomyces sp. WZ.A104]PCG85434.1 hypothetical protein CIB93_13835 [Streptomyces sp. WZ.A104]
MIDEQRILKLAARPREGRAGEDEFSAAARIRTVSFLDRESDPLAMPIRWSAALCGSTREATTAVDAEELCAVCPISAECSTALMAGAPAHVSRWRDRLNRGQAIAS